MQQENPERERQTIEPVTDRNNNGQVQIKELDAAIKKPKVKRKHQVNKQAELAGGNTAVPEMMQAEENKPQVPVDLGFSLHLET